MKYFAIIDGEQKGPFELHELADAGVRPSTYVWCKGMDDWEKAEDVADICRLFRIRIHDLMHPGSVEAERRAIPEVSATKPTEDGTSPTYPSRFDRYANETGSHIPTLEEIDAQEDTQRPPAHTMPLAIVATILFFPPTGLAAIWFSHMSRKCWNEAMRLLNGDKPSNTVIAVSSGNEKDEIESLRSAAHACCRSAKMWTGISFFLGLILYAFLSML